MATLKATSKLHRRFCQRLESERNKRGMSKAETARLLEMTPQLYGDMESGRRKPRIDTIERVAEAFEIEPEKFLLTDD